MAEDRDYQQRITDAALRAVFETSIVVEGGQRFARIKPSDAAAGLLSALASILLESGSCKTEASRKELARGAQKALIRLLHDGSAYQKTAKFN